MAGTHDAPKTRFEGSAPILRVTNMEASLRFYVNILGFRNAAWGNEWFTSITRDHACIYLCQGAQGCKSTWAWIGVDDAQALYEELEGHGSHLAECGAKIHHAPRNYPWALEMHVEDPDGHVLRFGSAPLSDRAFQEWEE